MCHLFKYVTNVTKNVNIAAVKSLSKMIKNIYCRVRRLSMEEGKLREALYSEYCKARGVLSLDDAGIDKFLQEYINENCDKYDIGKLNNYCNLAPNN